MRRFAQDTTVTPEQTKLEIEQTLRRYGATNFYSATYDDKHQVMLGFSYKKKMIKFEVSMPLRRDAKTDNHHEKLIRQRWRALKLVLTAMLEAAEAQILTFEEVFMAHILVPTADGGPPNTLGRLLLPKIEQAYLSGKAPSMDFLALPAPAKEEK